MSLVLTMKNLLTKLALWWLRRQGWTLEQWQEFDGKWTHHAVVMSSHDKVKFHIAGAEPP